MTKLIEGVHYHLNGDRVVFTALFHLERGQCCGNGCRHCPYNPKHTKGKVAVAEEFSNLKNNLKNGSE